MKPVSVSLTLDKETPNTYKFVAQQTPGQPPVIDRLYIQKWVFPRKPAKVEVTIQADEL